MFARVLESAGVFAMTRVVAGEGHGVYTEAHRRAYHARVLAFLARHLGGATAR